MKTAKGFTLIELLLVIGIVVLITSFVVPAVGPILRGSQLTQANQMTLALLGLARQEALTQNRTVEVRFYRYGDPQSGENAANPDTGKFRALQAFMISASGTAAPLAKMTHLPAGILIESNPALSSAFGNGRVCNSAPSFSIPQVDRNYKYYSIRFNPDGSTDLPPTVGGVAQLWFLTLHNAIDGDNRTKPPANYWTIVIDPINGALKSYRP